MTVTSQSTSRFRVMRLPISGVYALERRRICDHRGFLTRLFCADELTAVGWRWPIVQVNHGYTKSIGTVRGLHYQIPPYSEAKLVSCIRGSVWDVAVDLRAGSPTFLRWYAQELSADNGTALLIPPGCAHGFQALTDNTELLYLHSGLHIPSADSGLNPRDPRLNIPWPLSVNTISDKDSNCQMIDSDFRGLEL